MKARVFFWRFYGVYIAIFVVTLVAIAGIVWYGETTLYRRLWVRDLAVQADIIASVLPWGDDGQLDIPRLESFLTEISRSETYRVTLFLPDGRFLGDSQAAPQNVDVREDRREIRMALESGTGLAERYGATLKIPMLYFARSVVSSEGELRAVVRISVPLSIVRKEKAVMERWLFGFIGAMILTAVMFSYRAALRVIGPINDLQEGMERFGRGQFGRRVKVPSMPGLSDLARSVNAMAGQLDQQMLNLREERNLRLLILRALFRGVIAVDCNRRIMDMNLAARKFLGIGADVPVEGCPLTDVARLAALFVIIDQSERSAETVAQEVRHNNQILDLRALALSDLSGKRIGTLILISDETKLRKLETVRQDFVANVSHELRTPITSIKGFAETLLEGALHDPETAERFVQIIHRQSNQLESILYDLMELAHLEQYSKQSLERKVTPVAPVLHGAAQLCREHSPNTKVEIRITVCPEDLAANIH